MQDFFRYVMSAALAVVTAMAPPSLPFHTQAVPPVLSAADASLSDTLAREQCLAISLGLRAASECGDLRLAHALPSVRTYEKDRAPVLVYNSDHASPHPIVAANVALSAVNLSRVTAVLRVNGRQRALGQWMGATWPTTGAARIAVAYDATQDSTNVYRYTLDVTAFYGADSATSRMSGRIAVVNRVASVFGAGWWIDGLEQLFVDPFGNPGLWIGGDGSVRRYVAVRGDSTAWTAASIDRPDTLKRYNAGFERIVSGGVRVRFDAQGRHVATVNRLGHMTTFGYDGQNRLQSIVVPPSAAAASYAFVYGGANRLTRVTLSAGSGSNLLTRVTTMADSGGRVLAITDPDGIATGFGYDGPSSARVTARTDKRGTVTHFRYADGIKVSGSMTELRTPAGALTDSIAQRIVPAETQGLTGGDAVAVGVVSTLLDGPRRDLVNAEDTTRFYVNRSGAPRKIRDALGNETTLMRDGAFPSLVTQMIAPNQFTTLAHYDARGNPDSVTAVNPYADGRNAITTYAWEPAWDALRLLTLPEGESSTFEIDPASGNRLWEENPRVPGSRVTYRYGTSGQLAAVEYPVVDGIARVDSVGYDASGNLQRTLTVGGGETQVTNDALGRPIAGRQRVGLVGEELWLEDSTVYDLMGQDTLRITHAPAMNGAGVQRLLVRHLRTAAGADSLLARWSDPDTTNIGVITTLWGYDGAGRRVTEVATDGAVDRTVYDPAGNAVELQTRRIDPSTGLRLVIALEYDALNRLVTRRTPEVRYGARNAGIPTRYPFPNTPGENPSYPRYPNDGADGYRVAADVATFAYDALGRDTLANNADAQVSRTYYPGGGLQSETQRIRTVDGADFTQHVYTLGYRYDRNGRRTEVRHPGQLAPTVLQNTTGYAYDPATGLLATVTDALGNQFAYGYDVLNALRSLTRPGGVVERYGYDAADNLLRHRVGNGSVSSSRSPDSLLRATAFTYDARGKLLAARDTHGPRDTVTALYSGLGHVVQGGLISHGHGYVPEVCWNVDFRLAARDAYRYDALGNLSRSADTTTITHRCGTQTTLAGQTFGYVATTARLAWTQPGGGAPRDTLLYDAAGNVVVATQVAMGATPLHDRVAYYASDGTVRATDTRVVATPTAALGSDFRTTFEEYRVDALGRRVWVRARRYCENDPQQYPAECNLDKLRRTVWDGSAELYEIQMPGGDGSPWLENDTAAVALPPDYTGGGYAVDPNPFYGRVAYTHGLGIDRPVSVLRLGYGDRLDTTGTAGPSRTLAPFALQPLWNSRGQADLGVFADGGLAQCAGARCVNVGWPGTWFAYARPQFRRSWWHGSLVEDKRDESGLYFRRARSYDPGTARFTQEDPIGLAGGLNLYGFAGGDPVNFSDPFGLCPPNNRNFADCDLVQRSANWAAENGHTGLLNTIAGVDAVITAIGETTSLESGGIGGPATAGGRLLFRFGTKAETLEGLTGQAAKAEAGGFGHGVSVTTRKPTIQAAKSAVRTTVEEFFSVRRTGNTPGHHTVDLPKPVTQQVTDLFNQLFKP